MIEYPPLFRFSAGFESGFARAPDRTTELIGTLAVSGFAFFWLLHNGLFEIAQALLLLTFFWTMARGGEPLLKNDAMLWLVVAWIGYQFLFVPFPALEFPVSVQQQIEYARQYTKVGLILVVAWWLGGSVRAVAIVLSLAVAGFLLGVTFQPSGFIDDFRNIIDPATRPTLGYHNWEHASVYAAFALLTLVGLFWHIVDLFGRWKWLGVGVVALGAVYSLALVVFTQTRATWLGLMLAAVAAVVLKLVLRTRGATGVRERPIRWGYAAAVLMLGAGLFHFSGLSDTVTKRLTHERDVIADVLAGDTEDIRLSSVGIRITIWEQATDWITERPLMGWGPKTRDYLFQKGDLPEVIWKRMDIRHFHNQIIELAIAYGLVGLGVFASVIYLTGRAAVRGYRRGAIPQDVFIYGAAFFVYWLTVNMFESYFNYNTGAILTALVGGAFYSFRFTERET